jgi:transposase
MFAQRRPDPHPMPRRSLLPPDPPTDLIPADFIARHDLLRRLYLDPLTCLTPPRPWAPLTEAEWALLEPYLAVHGCALGQRGRPMDCTPRARLDAIFRFATLKLDGARAPWRILPEAFGKPDTVSRSYRRWAQAGLWAALLVALARWPRRFASLAHRICAAFRRAIRHMGSLRAIMLARRLKLFSALPAPSQYLPDEDLSEIYRPIHQRFAQSMRERPWYPPKPLWHLLQSMHSLAGGRARVPKWMEPA